MHLLLLLLLLSLMLEGQPEDTVAAKLDDLGGEGNISPNLKFGLSGDGSKFKKLEEEEEVGVFLLYDMI